MLAIVGIVVVILAVIGGYLMEKGNIFVLFQPAEFVIIGGAALGSFLVATPKHLAMATFKKLKLAFRGHESTSQDVIGLLVLLFELMNIFRREGATGLEDHVNSPEKSKIFISYPAIMADHEVLTFICDNLKMVVAGNVDEYEFDNIMEIDLESRHGHALSAPQALTKLADSLPGLGIVAAVLGVVVTMGKINEPPEVLGHSVGAALVGTFLGILACYGVVGPLATNLEHEAMEGQVKLKVVKTILASSVAGLPPLLAVEAGRRAAPGHNRPSYEQLDEALRNVRKQQTAKTPGQK